ncbi:hypothetical protein JB92DRAFT_3119264 [Gautieria morchelliformis]|nr:hypothetical protein JB92DRAFT_3119264 [Gautieria morchelliformis]
MINALVQYSVNVVVEVEFRKMPSAPYHEFFIFKVEDPRYSPAGIVVIDRYVGEVTEEELWCRAIPADSDEPELRYVAPPPPAAYQKDTITSVAGPGLLSLSSASSIAASSAASNAASELSMAASMKLASSVIPDKPALDRLVFLNVPSEYYVKKHREGSFRHEEVWVTANQRLKDIGLYNQSLQEAIEAKQKEAQATRKAEADAQNEGRARQKVEEEIKQLKRPLQISEANSASSRR